MKKKILIFIPAYNVEKKIIKVIKKIPKIIFKLYKARILIVNDNSKDKTQKIVNRYIKHKTFNKKLYLINNKKNLGYGGVQKIGYNYAIKKRFEYVVLLHGDGQYPSQKVLKLIKKLIDSNSDGVFGSRMMNYHNAIKGGMPIYKFFGNILLTFFQNLVLSSNFSEFHSGYRSYKVSSLKKINFTKNTNNFHFDTEIIIQFLKKNFVINEIPIPTHYGDEISHLKSIPYGFNIIRTTIMSKFKN